MREYNDTIRFENEDMHFIKEFGLDKALEMVLDFKAVYPNLPFIYDTYQLANFLHLWRGRLFKVVRESDRLYAPLTLKKKNGKERTVYAPLSVLKDVQSIICRDILDFLPVSKYATAYKKGATLYSNAIGHINKKYLLKLDITDFFGSITFEQVYSAAFNTKYFPKHIGVMLTELCTRKEVLVQGSPSSPALSNLVMKNFDDNLGAWCEKRGITYTRYSDDMTFSSDKPLYNVYEKVKKMLYEMGFELNEEKTRFITNSSRQIVTGLTVNEKVSVSREYKRQLRQQIHYALKFGCDSAARRMGVENGWTLFMSLIGKLNFVLQIEPYNEYFEEAREKLWKMEFSL